jgi:hypothetical protein
MLKFVGIPQALTPQVISGSDPTGPDSDLNGKGFPLNKEYMDITSLDYQLIEKTYNLGIDFVGLERHVATKIVKFVYVLKDNSKGYTYVRIVREGKFPSNHFETDCDKKSMIGVCKYKIINGWLIYTVNRRVK